MLCLIALSSFADEFSMLLIQPAMRMLAHFYSREDIIDAMRPKDWGAGVRESGGWGKYGWES